MATRMLLGVLVGTLLAACTTTGSTPATTPTPGPTTTVATTTTTTPPTTTSAPDRLAEIQAIFQDLEERRLDALYRGDVEAFSALFANEAYLERSLEALDKVAFIAPPFDVDVVVVSVLADTPGCIAAAVSSDYSRIFESGGVGTSTIVLSPVLGYWGYSYVGEGWICEGPHPLSG